MPILKSAYANLQIGTCRYKISTFGFAITKVQTFEIITRTIQKSRRPSQASGLNKQNLVFTITALADGYCKK